MKHIPFIATLVTEEKLKLVEPSEPVAASYAVKSQNALHAADLLLGQGLLEEATSMAYYAMYHKATALFYLVGIKCENHAATIIILQALFGIDNTTISFAKKERIDKQYYPDFQVTKKEVEELRNIAQEFIGRIDFFIDKLTNDQKQRYIDALRKMYF